MKFLFDKVNATLHVGIYISHAMILKRTNDSDHAQLWLKAD